MNLRTDADKLEKVKNVDDIKNNWNSFLFMSLFLQIKMYFLTHVWPIINVFFYVNFIFLLF
jgi:hypothetical protein